MCKKYTLSFLVLSGSNGDAALGGINAQFLHESHVPFFLLAQQFSAKDKKEKEENMVGKLKFSV